MIIKGKPSLRYVAYTHLLHTRTKYVKKKKPCIALNSLNVKVVSVSALIRQLLVASPRVLQFLCD